MSTQFFKFKPLLLSLVLCILTGLVSRYAFGSSDFISIFSGLLAFCLTLCLYIYIKQLLVLKKLDLLHHGILSYEKHLNERLHDLTNNISKQPDVESPEPDGQNDPTNGRSPKTDQNLDAPTLFNDSISSNEDNKVVELHPNKNPPRSNKLLAQLDMSDEAAVGETLNKGIKIQLQPAITLGSKEIYSFDAMPCLTDNDNYFMSNDELNSTFKNEVQQRIINQITLDQTIVLVRKLRRQKKSPLVFVELLSSTINDKEAYGAFVSALKAHHQVKKNIIIEVAQFDFLALTKSGIAKLRLILDLGYTLSMSNCTDVSAASEAIKKSLFGHIKLTIDTIDELSVSKNGAKDIEIITLCRNAKVNIIGTGIEKDYQIIQLIDNHVTIAEGSFFSKPKFPTQSDLESAAVGKK